MPTVPTYPYHFHCLASTDLCANHGMVLFENPLPPLAPTEPNGVKDGTNHGMHIDNSPSPLSTNRIANPGSPTGDAHSTKATNANGDGTHPHTNGSTDTNGIHTNGIHSNGAYEYQGHADNDNDDDHNIFLGSIRILTVQGHPEFHAGIISALVDMRSQSGVLTPEFAEETRRHNALELPIPGLPVYNNNEGAKEGWLNEGTSFGAVIWAVLGLV